MRGLLFGGDLSCNCVVDMEMYKGLSLETDQFDHSICPALALQLQGLSPHSDEVPTIIALRQL